MAMRLRVETLSEFAFTLKVVRYFNFTIDIKDNGDHEVSANKTVVLVATRIANSYLVRFNPHYFNNGVEVVRKDLEDELLRSKISTREKANS